MQKVFISSTIHKNDDLRASIHNVFDDQFDVLMSDIDSKEFIKRKGVHSHDACLDVVKECDIFILLITPRYGSVYNGEKYKYLFEDGIESITWMETKVAVTYKKTIYAFMYEKLEDEKFRVKLAEKAGKNFQLVTADKIEIFKFIDYVTKLPKDNWIEKYINSEDLKKKLFISLNGKCIIYCDIKDKKLLSKYLSIFVRIIERNFKILSCNNINLLFYSEENDMDKNYSDLIILRDEFRTIMDSDAISFGVTFLHLDSTEINIFNKENICIAKTLAENIYPKGIGIHKLALIDEIISNKLSYNFSDRELIYKEDKIRCLVESTVDNLNFTQSGTEVHVTGICIHNSKILLQKRSQNRELFPSKWATPGGRIRIGESFESALTRIFNTEAGIKISGIKLLDTYFIEKGSIPGILFLCNISEGRPINKDNKTVETNFFMKEQINELILKNEALLSSNNLINAMDANNTNKKQSLKLRIIISNQCFLNCKFCHKENVEIDYMTNIENIKNQLVDIGKIYDFENITLTGGEPLYSNNIDNFVQICDFIDSQLTVSNKVSVITNAMEIDEEKVKILYKYNLNLKVSIYGYDNDSFIKYTGYKIKDEYYTILNRAFSLLDKYKVSFSLNILLRNDIDSNIAKLYSFLDNLKVTNRKIRFIEMVTSTINDQFKNEYIKVEDSHLFKEGIGKSKNDIFSINTAIDYSNSNILSKFKNVEFYRYPCVYENDFCSRCYENWALIMRPNGTLQICENAIPDIEKSKLKGSNIQVGYVDYKKQYAHKL
jgi:molybdenum cofactor biosynthesis enzyme MoaA/ADP-ribose pyrophosphatase YjhB (NUDIX family)